MELQVQIIRSEVTNSVEFNLITFVLQRDGRIRSFIRILCDNRFIILPKDRKKPKQNRYINWTPINSNKHFTNALISTSYLFCTISLASGSCGNTCNFALRLVWYDDSCLATPHDHSRSDFILQLTSDKLDRNDNKWFVAGDICNYEPLWPRNNFSHANKC